jgi:tetratricopeptide (TPR) repeat protein
VAFSLFGKKSSQEIPDDQLLQMAVDGNGSGALAGAEAKVATAAQKHGEDSGQHAAALFVLSEVCLALRLFPRAVGVLRQASRIRTGKPEDERNRLTYLMNLGDYLVISGELDEALATHAESLEGRRTFYGEDHPGFGFGLDSWACAAISLGKYAEATDALRRALDIYNRAGHARFSKALGLLMLASAGCGNTVKMSQLGPDAAKEVLQAILGNDVAPKAGLMTQAVRWTEPFLELQDRMEGWATIQRRATEQGDFATSAEALKALLELAESTHDDQMALDAEQGLGYALERGGDAVKALEWYRAAERRARNLGGESLAKTLRNYGLFLCNGPDLDRGIGLLAEASGLDGGEQGARAMAAWGIQLQHRKDAAAAGEKLRAALQRLDPAHPDAICAASHLKALDAGTSCACGSPSAEIDAQVERLIRERVPADLLESVKVNAGEVTVHARRALTEEEARELANAVELAKAELRGRLTRVYG